MKTFKDLLNEAPAQDYVAPKDDDEEATKYKPRSKGEQQFADMHAVDVKDHPVSSPAQHKGHEKVGDPEEHKGGKKQAPGETQPIKQGSSDVKPGGTPFKSFKQFAVAGEKTPVMQGSSKIKEDIDSDDVLEEQVVDTLKKIKDRKQMMPVKFKNGKTLKVDTTTAGALLAVHDALKPANAKKFRDNLEKGQSSFMSMVDFAMQNV